ncbi:MAG: carboxypeptidase-like regulatory domain-containing protein [Ignavibacteriaceae bacterium]|nr:carboxypeptidase-like regulatory domain-containing protein [Ignavibacteriaceae bacterium]
MKGFVCDENETPLTGVNILLINTNTGSTSNSDGRFIFKLNSGINFVVFSYVGFIRDTLFLTLERGDTVFRQVKLKPSFILMPEITVSATEISESERLIKKVIENKSSYLNKLNNYSYDAYTRTVLFVPIMDSVRFGGITQILSKGYFEKPDKFQEVILSKIQTKNITEAHNIFSIGKIPNVLEEYLIFDDERIISPLNSNALKYYNYQITDTMYLSGDPVYNVEFNPQNKNLPLFTGTLSILGSKLVPVKVELSGKEKVVSKVRKNIEVKQQHQVYENQFWLPIEVTYNSVIDLGMPGFPPISLNQQSLISSYEINDTSKPYLFDEYILKQEPVSGRDSDILWKVKQVQPLTDREQREFARIDSIVENANLFFRLAINLTRSVTAPGSSLITSINDFYHFNRVEGNYLGAGLNLKEVLHPFIITASAGYGFSDRRTKYLLSVKYGKNPFAVPYIKAFNRLNYADKFYEYNRLDITAYSLLFKDDYADYYYSSGYEAGIDNNISNNLSLSFSFLHEKHSPAYVNTGYSFFNKEKKYRNPYFVQSGVFNSLNFSFKYNNQNYYDFGFISAADVSQNYTEIKYDLSVSSDKLNSDFSFVQSYLSLRRHQKFSPALNVTVTFNYGKLKKDKAEQFKFHLPGNYGLFGPSTTFRTIASDEFRGSDYYAVFVENNFKNILFNLLGVPFLKNSRYDLVAYYNGGILSDEPFAGKTLYQEAGLGIDNIITFLRFDFTKQLTKHKTEDYVFSLRLSL